MKDLMTGKFIFDTNTRSSFWSGVVRFVLSGAVATWFIETIEFFRAVSSKHCSLNDGDEVKKVEKTSKIEKEAEESDRQALEAQKARLSQSNTADSHIPKGEPPINGSSDITGTKLELPPSLMEKSDESDYGGGKAKKEKSPEQKSSKTKDHVKGAISASTATTASSSNVTTDATQVTGTLSTQKSNESKNGEKSEKNKKL
uniref:Uncharacterized protein n=1 Tax=Panagrolaimus davidi TaxID=227884 RepID=A0A914P9N1_9BILA